MGTQQPCQWKIWSTCSVVPRKSLLSSMIALFSLLVKMRTLQDRTSSASSAPTRSSPSELAWALTATMRISASRAKESWISVPVLPSRKSTPPVPESGSTERRSLLSRSRFYARLYSVIRPHPEPCSTSQPSKLSQIHRDDDCHSCALHHRSLTDFPSEMGSKQLEHLKEINLLFNNN